MARDLLSDPRAAARTLADLSTRGLNYDLAAPGRFTAGNGWNVDDYIQPLPSEGPGPPEEGGPWEVARGLLREYEFVDPAIVRALYRAGDPLEGRTMLLELRFWGLRFHVGVRVAQVTDGVRVEDDREVVVWGWSYRTLVGHLEEGQMDYEVRKWVDTGVVEFHIHAFWRAADIGNPIVRLGFRLFGRREQKRFVRTACERMRRLTEAELTSGGPRLGVSDGGVGLVIRPAAAGAARCAT